MANLPAEIAHLYEEAEAKQATINQHNGRIAHNDGIIQRHVKAETGLRPHPREETLVQEIRESYHAIQRLQDEKVTLVSKAAQLLDRHLKRLDVKIRDLQSEGSMPMDSSLPTLLRI